jgi:hypothetical protein
MVANKNISGAGSMSGPGNIMGNATNVYSINLSITNGSNNGGIFMSQTLDWIGTVPTEVTDHWTIGVPKTVTISGLSGGNAYLNGQTFNAILTPSQLITWSPQSLEDFITTNSLFGHLTTEFSGFTINWSN